MKKVIVQLSTSVDGYVEGPYREIDWHNVDGEFLDQGLVDEVRIILTPILLGEGRAIFSDITTRHRLKLLSALPFTSGNVVLTYEPRRPE